MVDVRGKFIPPIALSSIRIPSQRQGFRRVVEGRKTRAPASILLNVVQSELHSLSNILTRAPVDGEADRAQHIITEPIRLSIRAIVSAASDSTVDSNQVFFAGVDFRNRLDSGSSAVQASTSQILRNAQLSAQVGISGNFTGYRNYTTFWARLQALNAEKTPFEYISDLQVYQDMVFASIDVERTTAEWIEFTAELEEFRTVGVTRDRWLSEDQADDSRDGTDAGTKTPSPVEINALTPEATPQPVSTAIQVPTQ